MTHEEAISYLGGHEDHVEEFITQEVFDLKTKLLKGTLVPQVLKKKAEKLSLLAEALVVLDFEDESLDQQAFDLTLIDASVGQILDFYRQYEKHSSQLKLQLMQAFHPRIVAQLLNLLAELENTKFRLLFNHFNQHEPDTSTKLSDYIDSGIIISELKSIDSSIDLTTNLDAVPSLKKEINKSIKYCKFVDEKNKR
ncbi:hypothetical protein [Parvicella tangerina]|uniref:Uncharacterized protein n=1 Tax=Parvicella tangerina TaxID=2829795 RepID=A0A916JIL8_9FLAO|nr:hypothetical protein [Parvicella tangerina]CAG5076863.1 hypothetical protein CRYO30217_00225 [Parvicella tangerina]